MTLYSSRNTKSEIAFVEAMKQAGIEVILTDVPWGEWECMVNTTEHDKEVIRKFAEWIHNKTFVIKARTKAEVISVWLAEYEKEQKKEGGENG